MGKKHAYLQSYKCWEIGKGSHEHLGSLSDGLVLDTVWKKMPGQRSVVRVGEKYFSDSHSRTPMTGRVPLTAQGNAPSPLKLPGEAPFPPAFLSPGSSPAHLHRCGLAAFSRLTMSAPSRFPSSLPICMKKLKLQL